MLKKFLLSLLLLLLSPLAANAALRGTAVSANTTAALSISLNLASISGLAVGDVVILGLGNDHGSATFTITGSTFLAVPNSSDQQVDSGEGTSTSGVRYRIIDGTETTITIAVGTSSLITAVARAYSGRAASPFTVTPVVTGPIARANVPVSLSITGIAGNAGDDLVLVVPGGESDPTDTWTFTAPTSPACAHSLTTYSAATFSQVIGSCDVVGYAGGATGTLTGGALTHAGGGASQTGYVAYLISLAAGGGSGAALVGAASDTTSATGALTNGSAAFVPLILDSTGRSDQIGMGSGPGTGSGDTAEVAFTKLKQWASDLNAMFAQIFPNRSLQTPTTGFSIAAGINVTQLVLNPAGTLSTGTVTMPVSPGDNQPFQLFSSQTVTTLTMNTSDGTTINGAPTTIIANTSVKFRFVLSLSKWFRE